MAYINHPVVGDSKYGDFEINKYFEKTFNFKNQFLQAYELDFKDVNEPINNLKHQNIVIDLDKEYLYILKKI